MPEAAAAFAGVVLTGPGPLAALVAAFPAPGAFAGAAFAGPALAGAAFAVPPALAPPLAGAALAGAF